MKRIIYVILGIAIIFYVLESSSLIGLTNYKPNLQISSEENKYNITWKKLPYLAYYQVEAIPNYDGKEQLSAFPAKTIKYRTWKNHFTIDQDIPENTFIRVSAQGIFRHPIGFYSEVVNLAKIMKTTPNDLAQTKPVPTTNHSLQTPVSQYPFLSWTGIQGAVQYELEILSAPPENPNDILPSRYQVYITKNVYNNAYIVDLSTLSYNYAYWRVRAIDYDGQPIGVFSNATKINIDHSLNFLLKPYVSANFNQNNAATPLYPVYSWIPIPKAVRYEVELTNKAPENPNDFTPSTYRIWSKIIENGNDCYDEEARNTTGTYYWRVRGLDADGQPIGVWSDAVSYIVDLNKGNYAATLGDSITHGGGGISYSPADLEYSYQAYLKFPVVNLGRSGDTAETMNERFDHDILPYKPRYLLILSGTNSLRGGVPAKDVIKDLESIKNKCISNNIRPIFLTLPPINPQAIYRAFQEETVPNWRNEFDTVNKWIQQQRYYIDLDPYLCDANRELPSVYGLDGLHPDIQGKKLMAQIINAKWNKVTK